MEKQRYFIHTFGCQMNEHDSQRIAGILEADGYSETSNSSDADVVLLNTCCVRAKAEQKVLSEIGKLSLLKARRNFILAVCGCMAQKEKRKIIKRFPEVDIVLGTNDVIHLKKAIDKAKKGEKTIFASSDFKSFNSAIPFLKKGNIKEFVTIMEGCNNFCSYCIVPFVRGRERSRPVEDIICEVEHLAKGGCKEVTLLGQNVNSYNSPSSDACDFSTLLEKINEIEGIERIRFVTSHPKDFDRKLINAIKRLDKVCRNIHLPLQSGSDKILKLMNRNYTVEEYMEKIELLKSEIPEVGISSDIIVGFPGEDEEDFNYTLNAIEKIRFDTLFSFCYSHRPPAKSSTLDETLTIEEKLERLNLLQSIQRKISMEKNIAEEGKIRAVLVEGVSKRSSKDLTGRTEQNRVVNFKGDESLIGKIVQVKITKAYSNSLRGRIDR